MKVSKIDPELIGFVVLIAALGCALIGLFVYVEITCPGHMEAMAEMLEEMFSL